MPEASGQAGQAASQRDGQSPAGPARQVRFLDLTQDFSLHTPAFAGYPGPAIRWIKRLAFEKAGGQEITMTLHVSTHLDAPAHFMTGGKFIGDLPLDFLIGPEVRRGDRKSTRLNSSHLGISYAVFCLKKKRN